MLIDLGLRFIVNPALYVGTLAVRLNTDNRPECGVFSGVHDGFEEDEQNQPMPHFTLLDGDSVMGATMNFDDLGMYDFIIDRPVSRAQEHQVRRYNYVVRGWNNGVYYEHQDIWVLVLQEMTSGWDVGIHRPGMNGFTLILPDYQPGFLRRTNARAL